MMLRGAGVAIGLPWLEAMQPAKLVASSRTAPDTFRMIFLNVPNGAHMASWTPSAEGPEYSLSPILTPLQKHRKQLSVFTGLTLDGAHAHGDGGGDHARSGAAFLTGAHPKKTDGADIQNSISVDQVAAQALGQKTRFASLELGLEGSAQSGNCDSGYSCAYQFNLAWKNETMPLAPERDPRLAFERLFGSGDAGEEASRARRDLYNQSILDFVMDDAKALQKHLGRTDRNKLDEYLTSVRDIERRISNANQAAREMPDYQRPTGVPEAYQEHIRLMFDLMWLAFQTDTTRVATFLLAHDGSNRTFPDIGVPDQHHGISHHQRDPEKLEKIARIDEFYSVQLAWFLEKMKATKEGDGSLLDNSMIVFGGGISDPDRHNHDDLPVILAGGGGGTLTQGRHIRLPGETPMCNLYLSLLDRMGVKEERFGDSTGRLSVIS